MAMFTVLTGIVGAGGRAVDGALSADSGKYSAADAGRFAAADTENFARGISGVGRAVGADGRVGWRWWRRGHCAGLCLRFHFVPEAAALSWRMVVVPGLTVLTGFLMSRGVLNQPPLAILRGAA